MNDIMKYLAAALTGVGLLFGAGRYVGNLETRIHQLEERAERSEARGRFYHGDYQPVDISRTER